MRLEFYKQVTSDISRIMDYYENVAGPELADEFYTELQFYFRRQPTLLNLTAFESVILGA
jgi:hypothetical protein